jgi:uncharacterized protein YndB with AHSA1/START domain
MTAMANPAKPVLRITRMLPAKPQEVFAAWIDPDCARHWMAPGSMTVAELEMDPRPGGTFRLVMRGEQGEITHTGVYREVDPPRRLVFTWKSPATLGSETIVTVEFHERGDATELILTHEELPDEPTADRHRGGWTSIAEKLALYLASNHPVA